MRPAHHSTPSWVASGFVGIVLVGVLGLAIAGAVGEGMRSDNPVQDRSVSLLHLARLGGFAASERQTIARRGRADYPNAAGPISAELQTLARLSDPTDLSRIASLQRRYVRAVAEAAETGQVKPLDRILRSLHSYAQQGFKAEVMKPGQTPSRSSLQTVELGANVVILIAALLWLLGQGGRLLSKSGQPNPLARRIEDLQAEARTDSLTTLGNRRAFQSDLAAAIVRRGVADTHFALMAIDLDGLKQINDSKGHPAGDAHIQAVANCVERLITNSGRVYRTGGDEFMVILPNQRTWDALQIAERISTETCQIDGARAVSIGLTESTDIEGPQLLIRQADLALYEAKRRKSSAVTYDPGIAVHSDAAPSEIYQRRSSQTTDPRDEVDTTPRSRRFAETWPVAAP